MDFTPWLQADFDKKLAELNIKNEAGPQIDPVSLLYDFEKNKELIAEFEGPGPSFKVESLDVPTWQFKTTENKKVLIPAWSTLVEPQGKFEGLDKETPGKYIYKFIYNGYIEDTDKHDILIFRKLK